MTIRFDALRRMRRQAPKGTLGRREDVDLPFVEAVSAAGGALLLDTSVYIDQLQRKAPTILDAILDARIVNHSTVALQELLHAIGALNPDDPRSEGVIDEIGRAVAGMKTHRLFRPSIEVLARAAVLAGIVCRVQGYARDDRTRALNDCTLFLQADRLGLTVLTRNVKDFDLLLQLHPAGRVLFYRT